MVNFRIDIIVDPRRAQQGTKKVEDSMDSLGRASDKTAAKVKKGFDSQTDALLRQKRVLDTIKRPVQEFAQLQGDLNLLLREGKISQDEFTQALAKGRRKASSGFGKIGDSVDTLNKKTNTLARTIRRTFAGLGAIFVVRKLKSIADGYTELQNRLRLVTEDQENLTLVTARDGKSVVLNHRYDLWLQPLDGSMAKNLTGGVGAENEIRFRYVQLDPKERSIMASSHLDVNQESSRCTGRARA